MFTIGFLACENNEPQTTPDVPSAPTWLIDKSSLIDPGAGKDGIPALLNPELIDASEADYLGPDDLVIGYKFGNEARAYPHQILDYHEIVNDAIEDNLYAITYCPLTGTGTNWNRQINGSVTTFGVSGFLYNSNLIPYDRSTESLWSQMRLDCINGALIGSNVSTFHTVETTWSTWKQMYPNTKVLSTNTGYNRHYEFYPYNNGNEDYREIELIVFPVDNTDSRLHSKERVLGINNNGETRAYRFSLFSEGIDVVEDVVGGDKVSIIGSEQDNFMIVFYVDDEELEPLGSVDAGLFKDQNGNIYDSFGFVLSGPGNGSRLRTTESYIGYWFSWAAFHPEIEIFGE